MMRAYLYGLPFVAFLAALWLYPRSDSGKSWRTLLLAVLVSCVLLSGFLFAYYGRERLYYLTPFEVEAADHLYSTAPAGSLLVDVSWNWPQQYTNYEQYDSLTIMNAPRDLLSEYLKDPVGNITRVMESYPSAFLIISRAQKAYVDLTGIMPRGSVEDIERAVLDSPRFQEIYSNPDARIFVLAPRGGG
jgi:hypothetical protein